MNRTAENKIIHDKHMCNTITHRFKTCMPLTDVSRKLKMPYDLNMESFLSCSFPSDISIIGMQEVRTA